MKAFSSKKKMSFVVQNGISVAFFYQFTKHSSHFSLRRYGQQTETIQPAKSREVEGNHLKFIG